MAVTSATDDVLYNGAKFQTSSILNAIFLTISLYNATELIFGVFFTFKTRKGLYFWSLLVSTFGVILYSIGFLLWYYLIGPSYAGAIINNIGWITMVVGQSVVLYSRLHLILRSLTALRWILRMIVIDGIILYIPATVIQFGAYAQNDHEEFQQASFVFEKIQMTLFSIQELVISYLYIREMIRLAGTNLEHGKKRALRYLLLVQIIIVALDIGLLGLEYASQTIYEMSFKSVAYSIKLKLEFAVLGKMIESVRQDDEHPMAVRKDISIVRRSISTVPSRPQKPFQLENYISHGDSSDPTIMNSQFSDLEKRPDS